MHHTDKQYVLPPESDESFSPLARQILSLPAWWFNRRPEDGSTPMRPLPENVIGCEFVRL